MGNYGGVGLLGFDPRIVYTSAEAEALGLLPTDGQVIEGDNGARLTLVRVVSSIGPFQAVAVDTSLNGNDQNATPITTTNAGTAGGRLGVYQGATTASAGEYCFIHVAGRGIRCKAAIACQPNVPLFTTATAGVLDDATLSGFTYCPGILARESATSASAPFVDLVESTVIMNQRAAI
jgi:hypothetical protein